MIDGDNKKLLSDKTISKWFEIFRLAIAQEMVTRDKDKKIGGEGMEVEIDENHLELLTVVDQCNCHKSNIELQSY